MLKADGINCEVETGHAFDLAGGSSEILHINDLKGRQKLLKDYQIMVLSGGFSYGDHVRSGVVLARELTIEIGDNLREFIHQGGLILGVCNGFQVLGETGLLPEGIQSPDRITLTNNNIGHFRCDWTNLKTEKLSVCQFIAQTPAMVRMMVAHGEGRFYSTDQVVKNIENNKQVVFRYVNEGGNVTMDYPDNPNGSINAIAGLTDPTGRILGMMPHPERPSYNRKTGLFLPAGLELFQGMVNFTRQV